MGKARDAVNLVVGLLIVIPATQLLMMYESLRATKDGIASNDWAYFVPTWEQLGSGLWHSIMLFPFAYGIVATFRGWPIGTGIIVLLVAPAVFSLIPIMSAVESLEDMTGREKVIQSAEERCA